jgi:ubiquinone/menaquinone biosynthesis C-methylase UbiE
VNFGQRLARVATDAVVRRPSLWLFFRGPIRRTFDRLAPVWDAYRSPDAFAPIDAALETLETAPARVLDLGTGTGSVALLVAERFPAAEVIGVDVSERMIEEARRKGAGRVRFEIADAERLPFEDGSFDLVTLGNMIPFFDELARVTATGGRVLFSFSAGTETPIYVPSETLRRELGARGFADFAEFSAGRGTALLATKR